MSDVGAAPDVLLEDVSKRYGDRAAVEALSLRVEQGEFLALLGPSGCGKSTTLRLIAGLEHPTAGRVLVDGREPARLAPARRVTKLVFQNYALFPHMTVYENIAFGLKLRKVGRAETRRRVDAVLDQVGMQGRHGSRPAELSGGEQQRIALCRALVNEPRVLLLDEPFAALDAKITKTMSLEIKRLQQRLGITFVMVTHDQNEALTMADVVAVMNAGRLEQYGTPEDVYRHPCNAFTAQFVGDINLFDATVVNTNHALCTLRVGSRDVSAAVVNGLVHGRTVKLAVRPEAMALRGQPRDGENSLPGVCEEVTFRGARRIAGMRVEGVGDMTYVEVRDDRVDTGDQLCCCWRPDGATVLTA